jgi:predicted O-methyltransferase YrrM
VDAGAAERLAIPSTDRSATIRAALEAAPDRPEIVETGTIRDAAGWHTDGCSTVVFADWIARHGGRFVSIDIDPEAVATARRLLRRWSLPGEVVCADALAYLDRRREPIDLAYLDSLDFDFRFAGPSQRHALAEAQRVWTKLTPGGVVLLDDAELPYGGKPALARTWLLSQGAETLLVGARQVVMRKPRAPASDRT